MANLTLGLDVGCTSIGWALIDEEAERIVAVGVRVFPEGVDRDQQGGEKSKSQSRRDARSMRRQLAPGPPAPAVAGCTAQGGSPAAGFG